MFNSLNVLFSDHVAVFVCSVVVAFKYFRLKSFKIIIANIGKLRIKRQAEPHKVLKPQRVVFFTSTWEDDPI